MVKDKVIISRKSDSDNKEEKCINSVHFSSLLSLYNQVWDNDLRYHHEILKDICNKLIS